MLQTHRRHAAFIAVAPFALVGILMGVSYFSGFNIFQASAQTTTSSVASCTPVECASPPYGCYYSTPIHDANGCPINCGSLICINATITPSPVGTPVPAPIQCANPASSVIGIYFAMPCPALNATPVIALKSSGTISVIVTPPTSRSYIYKTIYVSEQTNPCPNGGAKAGGAWCSMTMPGTADTQVPLYLTLGTGSTLSLSGTTLSNFSTGTHYVVSWDWTWDATANCYKGPDGKCSTAGSAQYRLQTFTLQ